MLLIQNSVFMLTLGKVLDYSPDGIYNNFNQMLRRGYVLLLGEDK
ncbi:Uncharacterised protein [Streptococcus pseudoporcinus]|uniref:Uncharacterized protein n=1 Tax=Streptococcus pseudoporcinus TaxID=361101 RepID=A0A4U9XNI8_9STRE|nr:Uncharacterised protein [Streptococcus pseudoporcinus]VUC67127.1 Uncharacterised protein [Streptococcus pseudoporcinus]VUC98055.1 Uncharacterised protein [Streptococcus pseudoporcinus]VUC98446.1 Uncharacterised protein [Streptococcus pseudoporcinus]